MNTCRHIKELRNLKASEMTDEELLKIAVDRLNAKAGMLIYMGQDNIVYWFARYKNKHKGSHSWLTEMKNAWQKHTGGKLHTIKEK